MALDYAVLLTPDDNGTLLVTEGLSISFRGLDQAEGRPRRRPFGPALN